MTSDGLCQLCDTMIRPSASQFELVADENSHFFYHQHCFERAARGISLFKLCPRQVNVFVDGLRFVELREHIARKVCCAKDCELGCDADEEETLEIVCTNRDCDIAGMHVSCFLRLQAKLMEILRRQRSNTMAEDALKRSMFTSKYDLVRTACACACNKGFFKPFRAEKRHHEAACVQVVPPPQRQKKPALMEKKLLPPSQERRPKGCPKDSRRDSSSSTAKSKDVRDILSLVDRPIPDFVGFPPTSDQICPITRTIIVDPYLSTDGFTYERCAYFAWLNKFGTFPFSVLPALT